MVSADLSSVYQPKTEKASHHFASPNPSGVVAAMSNEANTCRLYVLPKLKSAGWTDDYIDEQYQITDGQIRVVAGNAKRGSPKKADYLLRYRGRFPLAIVEAKADYLTPATGMQQAMEYARMMDIKFAYSTNGKGIVEFDFTTGEEKPVEDFPTPLALWNRLRAYKGLDSALDDKLLIGDHVGDKVPRYYQQIAINRALEAIHTGSKRVLLTLATGTGKTVIAFQIAWKLYQARWNTKGQAGTRPRILFLADRTFLVDDPKDKTFAPFGEARYKIEGGKTLKTREIYFATYQALAGDDTYPGCYQDYPTDFFDLLIVDEAHRGSAGVDSSWRKILEYFAPAVQLGMTATPLRDDNRDTYDYFGEPVYTYSLRQGIQDGFLAPYQVRRIVIDIDTTGFRPFAGQLDDNDNEIPDKEYTAAQFERVLSLKQRTKAVAQHLTNYLKQTNRQDKTIVFCVDQDHAEQMRQELRNANSDITRDHADYVVKVTANDGEIGKGYLDVFKDVETAYPVILTTSRLLSTGLDAPTVKNVVLFRVVGTMTEFKQIIGRGTRVREDYGKLYFTILDYTGTASQKFADPDFDGDPVKVEKEETDENGTVTTTVDVTTDEATEPEEPEYDPYGFNSLYGEQHKIGERPGKYYLSKVNVSIVHETVQELDANGKVLRTVEFTTYTAEQVRNKATSAEEFRVLWSDSNSRKTLVESLDEKGIELSHLAEIMDMPDADPFDLLCKLAFNPPDFKIRSRKQRAAQVRKQQNYFNKFSEPARNILLAILDKYEQAGPIELKLPDLLRLPPINNFGNTKEIAAIFGGAKKLMESMEELQQLLYAA